MPAQTREACHFFGVKRTGPCLSDMTRDQTGKPSQPASPVGPFQGSVVGFGGGPVGCIHHDTGLPFAIFSPTPCNKTGHFHHGE